MWNHNTHYYPRLAARLPDAADRGVLDVGCGDGTFCRYIRARGRVVGTDVDSSVLPAHSQTAFAVASAEALPFADASFQAVTMVMVLHHVEPHLALAEAARVLTPGGVLLILGQGRFGGWRDGPHELRDLVTQRLVSPRMTPWEPPTAKTSPTDTWAKTRSTIRTVLPGASYRRLAMWRYLAEWHKPLAS